MSQEPPAPRKVGVGVRLLARIVDGLILLLPVMLITVPIAGGFQIGGGNVGTDQIVATALGVGFAYVYFVVCEARRGATFGKSALGLEVRAEGGHPGLEQAANRNAFMLVSIVPGGLGGILSLVVWIALAVSIARHGRGFHDRWADVVITRRGQALGPAEPGRLGGDPGDPAGPSPPPAGE
jgi:uncharacterized RDD family membrane protein YckC